MWGGGADSDNGLEEWQCIGHQQSNHPDQFDPIGYVGQ